MKVVSKEAKYRDEFKILQEVALFNANLTTNLGDEVKQLKEDFEFLARKVDLFLKAGTPMHGVPSGE
jgi:hypothetical protein